MVAEHWWGINQWQVEQTVQLSDRNWPLLLGAQDFGLVQENLNSLLLSVDQSSLLQFDRIDQLSFGHFLV